MTTIERLATLTAAYRVRHKVDEQEWVRAYEALVDEGGQPLHHGVVDAIIVANVPVKGLALWMGKACIMW